MPIMDIGDTKIGFYGFFQEDWLERYRTFLTSSQADYSVEVIKSVDWSLFHPFRGIPVLSKEGSLLKINKGGLMGQINLENRIGSVRCSAKPSSFDTLLRVLYSGLLLENNGFLLHSCGMVRPDGRGILFIGPSGSGKSTISTLSMDNIVLNDEVVAIKRNGKGSFIYSTPFWGSGWQGKDIRLMGSLSALFFIEGDKRVMCSKILFKEAVLLLMKNVLAFSKRAEITLRFIDIFETIVKDLPCYRLAFTKDTSFWGRIDDIIR